MRFPMGKKIGFVAIAVSLFCGRAALAQSALGSITGTVQDSTGASLPGVAVSAQSASTGVARTTISGRTGGFTFPLLPVGLYAVSAELSGFAPRKIANVSVSIGADTTLTLTMDPAGVEAAVTVSAAAPMVETT